MAWPGPVEATLSTCNLFARNRASAGPANFAERPPPAAGFTMAKNLSMQGVHPFPDSCKEDSQGQNRCGAVQFLQTLRQNVPFNLEGSCPRKVLLKENDPVNPLIV